MFGKLVLLSLLALAQGKPHNPSSRHQSAHDLCPKDQKHFLLPHEYDCTLFYYCEYGMRRIDPTQCAPGTEFSAELQVCIHPALANCNLPGIPPKEEVENGNQGGGNKPDVPESVEQQPDVDEETPVPVEPQPESEEQNPEVVEETPVVVEPQPESEEQKPEVDEETPVLVEPQPESEEHNPENKPEPIKPQPEPEPEPEKPVQVESEEQIESQENQESEEVKPLPVKPQPEPEEQIPESGNQKPEPPKDVLPNGCPVDIHEHWLLPHETECNQFYYCNFGEKVLYTCAPGTYFNYAIQVCDWPENVNCANTDSGPGDNGNGEGDNEISSGENENNNVNSGENNGNNGNSGENNGNHGNSGENNGNSGENHGNNGNSGENNGNHGNSGENNGNHGNSGENNGNSGEDHGNNGNSGENSSNSGSSEEENNGNNGNSGENNGNHGNSGENENNGNNTNSGENENSGNGEDNGLLPNGCPADFDVHQLLPHESNCSKFYYCVFGDKVETQCGGDLHFNPVLQVCDWPSNVNCGNNGNNNGNSEENNNNSGVDNGNSSGDDSSSSGSSEENSNNSSVDSNSGENNGNNGNSGENSGNHGNSGENENNGNGEDNEILPNGCPADFSIHHLLPHESDCSKFYYCVFGDKVETQCGGDLHFNPVLQVCDWPSNVNCGNNGNNNGNSEENNNNTGIDNGNSGEDNCNNGNSGEENGNNGNSGENENNGNGEGNEILPNGCPADFSIHHLLPHESDCSKFYYCVYGEKVVTECSAGLYFNPALQVCDWPVNVNCANNGNNGENNGNSEENNNSGVNNGNSGEDSSNNGGNGGNSEEDNGNNGGHGGNSGEDNGNNGGHGGNSEEDNGNNGENNGNSGEDNEPVVDVEAPNNTKCANSCNAKPWAHAFACNKYWRCDGNKAILVICSEGLLFNSNTRTCDFKSNVQCVERTAYTQS